MKLARFKQQPAERKNYILNYTAWLEDLETISGVVTEVDPPGEMTIQGVAIQPGSKQVLFSIGGGLDGGEYKATFTISTSDGQTKQDEVHYAVEDF